MNKLNKKGTLALNGLSFEGLTNKKIKVVDLNILKGGTVGGSDQCGLKNDPSTAKI